MAVQHAGYSPALSRLLHSCLRLNEVTEYFYQQAIPMTMTFTETHQSSAPCFSLWGPHLSPSLWTDLLPSQPPRHDMNQDPLSVLCLVCMSVCFEGLSTPHVHTPSGAEGRACTPLEMVSNVRFVLPGISQMTQTCAGTQSGQLMSSSGT